MDTSYFCHKSSGIVHYDPGKGQRHFKPWWAILRCDSGIVDFYSWLLLKYGIPIHKGSWSGPHISFIKGVEPEYQHLWGKHEGRRVEFRYTNNIRWDNGRHAWLDVWCDELHDVRMESGLPSSKKNTFHFTLGRLVTERENVKFPELSL